MKIDNNIILMIDDKYFNTFENKFEDINNENKKKYKNVTNQILHLQKLYGKLENVNYILNEKKEDRKETDSEEEDTTDEEKDEQEEIKKIVISKSKMEGGGGWGMSAPSEDEEEQSGGGGWGKSK